MSADNKVIIIMLGESGVGKSSLFLRYCKKIFREKHEKTSIDKFDKQIVLRNINIKLELWDTAGHERFKAVYKGYFQRAHGVILVYDLTVPTTFNKLTSWLEELRELNDTAIAIIVGNKTDLEGVNAVSESPARTYAEGEDLECFTASAKNNENVDMIFEHLTEKILEKRKIAPFYSEVEQTEEEEVVPDSGSLPPVISLPDDVIKLDIEKPRPKKKEGCC